MIFKTVDDVFTSKYFKINTNLLIFIGLWPYGSGWLKIVKKFIMISINSLMTIPFIVGAIDSYGIDKSAWSECTCGAIFFGGAALSYTLLMLNEKKIRQLFEKVAQNWIVITDPDEKDIILTHAQIGFNKSIFFTVVTTSTQTLFCFLVLLPVILDLIVPLNEPRQRLLLVKSTFLYDPNVYYWECFATYSFLGLCISLTYITINTIYAAVIQQNASSLNIVKHRIRMAHKPYNIEKDLSYDILIQAAKLHQDCFEDISLVEASYSFAFALAIAHNVLFLAILIIPILENKDYFLESIRISVLMIGSIIYLFYINWPGQLISDEQDDLFLCLCMSDWYKLSKRSKTVLHIMMTRCMKKSNITAGGLYVMNFFNYGCIIKTSVSYMTLAASLRH